ncbi:hypothetical protein HPB51_029315 [Rhipicephalus microplus]|uniref:Uncharacterized protein n=1 Tax=Rhipicephalus microplus TaxID=6941 RepID=A0A9J6CV28_RHIMP|nr:hypothetical protein HPB51_029315 [Rhipicephalus microplus]
MFYAQVLAAVVVGAESTVTSLTNEAGQRGDSSEVSGRPNRQGFEVLRLQDTMAALPSGFQSTEAVTYDAMNALKLLEVKAGTRLASRHRCCTKQNGGSFSGTSGEQYHASATDHYVASEVRWFRRIRLSGCHEVSASTHTVEVKAMLVSSEAKNDRWRRHDVQKLMYYHYGSGPKAYNTEHAYAYEKYQLSIRGGHAGGGYGYRHGESYGKGNGRGYAGGYGPKGYESRYDSRPAAASSTGSRGGARAGPKIKRYVYRNPYDKSTTRVVEMHSSRGQPDWAASNENWQVWRADDMERFVLGLMRNG